MLKREGKLEILDHLTQAETFEQATFTAPKGWRPIAGVDLQHREQNDWSVDFSARAGVQLDGVLATRKMQLLIEYFNGRSPNGQFYREKIEYIGLGTHFHF